VQLGYLINLPLLSFETKAPAEVVDSKLIGGEIFLNRDMEFWNLALSLDQKSDLTCLMVLHTVDTNFTIIKRFPLPVYFDL
jgi:hypothetical protein